MAAPHPFLWLKVTFSATYDSPTEVIETMSDGLTVAVVEPATPVGKEILHVLAERDFPVGRLVALAGRRYAGSAVEFRGESVAMTPAEGFGFDGVDLAFVAARTPMGTELIERARTSGCLVVDLGGHCALKNDVPLVIPELNCQDIQFHKGVIASPRPAAVELAMVLAPIHRVTRVKRAVITSFHPLSESGESAMDELTSQIRDLFTFKDTSSRVFPHQIAFNLIPVVGGFAEDRHTLEERAIEAEIRKILKADTMSLSVTCMQVPVFYAHAASVVVETDGEMDPQTLKKVLAHQQGLELRDDPGQDVYPTQVDALGLDECLVGRIRRDDAFDHGVAFFTACDNVRKGSAVNAVQIAELALAGRSAKRD